MRNFKYTVRRLTQTEFNNNEMRGGRLNDSLVDSLAPNQKLLYKTLIVDFEIDEAVAAFASM